MNDAPPPRVHGGAVYSLRDVRHYERLNHAGPFSGRSGVLRHCAKDDDDASERDAVISGAVVPTATAIATKSSGDIKIDVLSSAPGMRENQLPSDDEQSDNDDDNDDEDAPVGERVWESAVNDKDSTRDMCVILAFADGKNLAAPSGKLNELTMSYSGSRFFHVHVYFPELHKAYTIDQNAGHVYEINDRFWDQDYWVFYKLTMNRFYYRRMIEYCKSQIWVPYDFCGFALLPIKNALSCFSPALTLIDAISNVFTASRVKKKQRAAAENGSIDKDLEALDHDFARAIMFAAHQERLAKSERIFRTKNASVPAPLTERNGQMCSRFTIRALCAGGFIDHTHKYIKVCTPGDVHRYITRELHSPRVDIVNWTSQPRFDDDDTVDDDDDNEELSSGEEESSDE